MATEAPKPPKRVTKGDPPAIQATRNNLAKPEPGEIVALNFKIPSEFKKDFRIAAATMNITLSELLMRSFEAWKEKNG